MPENLVALHDRREAAIARISDGYAADLLDVDELDRRLELAHGAHTVAELDALTLDLTRPTTALAVQPTMAIDDPTRAPRKQLRAVLGNIERFGPWTVPRELRVRVLWGNCELDFRDASLAPGVTIVHVRVLMGNLELIVPPGLAVDLDVSAVLANVEQRHRTAAPTLDLDRPILRVTGKVRLGNLETTTRLPGETEGDARRRWKRHRRALRAG